MTPDPHDPERPSKKYRVAFLLLLWSVPAALAVGERYVFAADGVAAPTFWRVFVAKSLGWYAWAAMTPVIFYLARRFPISLPLQRHVWVAHISGCAAACGLHAAAFSFGNWLAVPAQIPSFVTLFERAFLGWLPISMPVYFGLVGGGHWLVLTEQARARERLTAALEAELARSQLLLQTQHRPAAPAAVAPVSETYLSRLLVNVGVRTIVVDVGDVTWIRADDYCVSVYAGQSVYVLRQSLARLEAQLDPTAFVRVHRSALVRVAAVTALDRSAPDRLALILRDRIRVPVSRSRRAAVLAALGGLRG